ncbi:MAG: transporter, partial [bacterium]|nr:transporter [bacterium]
KLAYICDSTSSPLIVLFPITAWAVYLSGLSIGTAGIADQDQAMALFISCIPYNFYGFLSVIFVLLISLSIIPDFGPMRKAEKRTIELGKIFNDGSVPMMSNDLTGLKVSDSKHPNIFLNFLLPVFIIIGTNLTTFVIQGKASILEGFMLACTVLGMIMWLQKVDNLRGIMQRVTSGIKGVMPAVIILALAYCINSVSREMGTAEYIVYTSRDWMSPGILPFLVFIITGLISFATGTAWGSYAIMMPIALPLAYQFSGGVVDSLVLSSFAAVAGGGVFGDHCSPLSDTTVLSSLGAACDHIDHVKTQLPYALIVASAASILYLIVGFI